MFTPEFILGTHQKLQDLLPEARVLVGGSYFYGIARTGSDLDLYAVVPTWQMFKVARALRRYQTIKPVGVSVMLVPTICLRLGLYTIEGIDVRGRRVLVNAGRGSEQAMSLKIALYYFCLAREQRSEEYLKKSAHQIAFHLTAGELERASLVERLQGEYYLKRFPMLRQVLLAKLEHTSINTVEVLPLVEKELQTIVEDYRPKMRFNWRMYLWYNFFFLRKKDTLFLLKNPDTMLITQLYTCLIHPEKWGEQKKMIARTVFPVMMY
jgi:hypothetical protein